MVASVGSKGHPVVCVKENKKDGGGRRSSQAETQTELALSVGERTEPGGTAAMPSRKRRWRMAAAKRRASGRSRQGGHGARRALSYPFAGRQPAGDRARAAAASFCMRRHRPELHAPSPPLSSSSPSTACRDALEAPYGVFFPKSGRTPSRPIRRLPAAPALPDRRVVLLAISGRRGSSSPRQLRQPNRSGATPSPRSPISRCSASLA